jgi:hypothetical protein
VPEFSIRSVKFEIQFNDHPVHASLKHVRDQLAGVSEGVREAASEHDAEDSIPRLREVLEYIGALLGSVDAALVSEQMLNSLTEPLQQISTALTPLQDNQDFGQIPTIQSNTVDLLNAAAQLAPAAGVLTRADAKKAASKFGEAATTKTKALDQQASSLQTRLDEIRAELDETSTSIKTTSEERLSELQIQLNALKTEAEAEREKVQGSIDGFQAQFNQEVEKRDQEFEEKKKELSDGVDAVVDELKKTATEASSKEKERVDNEIDALKDRGNEIIAFLNEKKDEAADLVDLVATSSTAGAFGKEANSQCEQADRWRRWAIDLGLLAAVVAVGSVAASFFVDSGVSVIIAKVTAVALLLGIAGYAAGQSGQHRRREQRAKRLELELIAFGPFTEPLDDQAKLEVRKAFIERLFVGDPGEDHSERDPHLSEENLSALAKLVDLIRSVPPSPTA